MSWNTGTINSATPAAALITALEAELTAHAAWTFVESVAIASNTHRVWKCEASQSILSADFYVMFKYATAGTGNVFVSLFEEYEAVTGDQLRRPAGCPSGVTPHADYSQGTTERLLSDTTNVGSFTLGTLLSTNFTWFCVASNSFLALGTTATTDYSVYVGCFDSLMADAEDPMPLVLTGSTINAGMSSSGGGAFTRHPYRTAANADNWSAVVGPFNTFPGSAIAVGTTDPYHAAYPVGRALVKSEVASQPTAFGAFRGKLFDSICSWNRTTIRNGDTITIGADVYRMFDMGTTNGVFIGVKETASS